MIKVWTMTQMNLSKASAFRIAHLKKEKAPELTDQAFASKETVLEIDRSFLSGLKEKHPQYKAMVHNYMDNEENENALMEPIQVSKTSSIKISETNHQNLWIIPITSQISLHSRTRRSHQNLWINLLRNKSPCIRNIIQISLNLIITLSISQTFTLNKNQHSLPYNQCLCFIHSLWTQITHLHSFKRFQSFLQQELLYLLCSFLVLESVKQLDMIPGFLIHTL